MSAVLKAGIPSTFRVKGGEVTGIIIPGDCMEIMSLFVNPGKEIITGWKFQKK